MTRRLHALLVLLCASSAGATQLSCGRAEAERGTSAPAARETAAARYALTKVAEDAAGGGDSAIAPDGQSFVTSRKRDGQWDLWTFDLRTQTWTQRTQEKTDDFEGQWSPDGSQIVFTSTRTGNKDIFVLTLADGQVRQLTDDPEDDEYPSFSPDGSTIIYTGGPWGARNFFVIPRQGGERRGLRGDPGMAGSCSFHPSGLSAICHAYDSGTGNVYLHPVSGGETLRITNGSFWDYKPAISPDARWVAFSRSEDGPSRIWFMPFPTGTAQPLTTGTAGDDRWPTWSRQADRLLFHRLVDRGVALRLYTRATGATRDVVDASESPGYASLHPDGQQLAYGSLAEGRERVRVRDLASGQTRTLATDGYEASFPAWSPDGRRLALAVRAGDRWDIATVDADGRGLKVWTRALPGLRAMHGPIDWSPDGTRVVFHASSRPFEADLYLLHIATGRVENLTRDRWFNEAPAFTPDGRGVTFMSTRGGGWTWGLFQLTLATRDYRLFAGPDYEEKNYPRLGRDGRTVWSAYGHDGLEYLVERAPDASVRTLTTAGSGARWPSYSRDGASILYTVMDRKVEYWLADHVSGAGSPLTTTRPMPQASPTAGAAGAEPHRTSARSSPVQMHHR